MRTFTTMKQSKEKTEAEKTIEKLKEKSLPKEAQEAIRKKQVYINREVNK